MAYSLYRAVTKREYNDILLQDKHFRCTEWSLEAKQFATTEQCGHYYGKEIVMRLDKVPYILLHVVINNQMFINNVLSLDNCTAVSIDKKDLDHFNAAIISISPI